MIALVSLGVIGADNGNSAGCRWVEISVYTQQCWVGITVSCSIGVPDRVEIVIERESRPRKRQGGGLKSHRAYTRART